MGKITYSTVYTEGLNDPHETPMKDPDGYARSVEREYVEAVAIRLFDRFESIPDHGLLSARIDTCANLVTQRGPTA